MYALIMHGSIILLHSYANTKVMYKTCIARKPMVLILVHILIKFITLYGTDSWKTTNPTV